MQTVQYTQYTVQYVNTNQQCFINSTYNLYSRILSVKTADTYWITCSPSHLPVQWSLLSWLIAQTKRPYFTVLSSKIFELRMRWKQFNRYQLLFLSPRVINYIHSLLSHVMSFCGNKYNGLARQPIKKSIRLINAGVNYTMRTAGRWECILSGWERKYVAVIRYIQTRGLFIIY